MKSPKLIEGLKISLKQFYFYENFKRLRVGNFSQINFMIILFWKLETPILVEELGISIELIILELNTPLNWFERIRNSTQFKIIFEVMDSIELYYFKLVKSRTPNCLTVGVKDSVWCIWFVELRTLIFKLVELRNSFN